MAAGALNLYKIVFAAFAAWACAQSSSTPLPFEFGRMRASMNGGDFTGMFGRDSTIAIWNSATGQLEIEGNKRNGRRRSQIVRITLRCGALPRAGTYAIRNLFSPVSADAFIQPTLWQRIWPLRGERYRAFVSDSIAPGTLVLDSVDSAKAIVKGRFEMALRTFNRFPPETLSVRGTFFGRLYLRQELQGPKPHWAAGMRTDCERIRDAVSM